ncbi:MAG TPA: hypothetical protein ENJ95_10765 [Bacteroidetes bacterium]|nr:hypothetical protein [Bacteroidota bacterium]
MNKYIRPTTCPSKRGGINSPSFGRASSRADIFVHLSWLVKIVLFNFTFVLFAFFLTNCANPISPTGGPRDETPPKLDTLLSTRNMQTRFEKQKIVLAFDEWVELKDAFNQVVVTPPLEFRHKVERKKKTIQFEFDEREMLRDSATYIINFGEAIRDLTEGNVAPVVFVFSTGDFIDSLTVEGEIMDAYTAEPVEGALFMMYENLADSVLRTERPFYFAKTDKGGKFKVSNVKSGTFKGVALMDGNLNYRFDNVAEKIAFLDTTIKVGASPADSIITIIDTFNMDTLPKPDSIGSNITTLDTFNIDTLPKPDSIGPSTVHRPPSTVILRLFEEEKILFLNDDDAETYGLVKLAFNREPYDAVVSYDSLGQLTFLENEKDSIRLWYSMQEDVPFNVYVMRDTVVDTVRVEAGLKTVFFENAKLKTVGKAPSTSPVQPPGEAFSVEMNHPLFSVNDSLVFLFEDSIKTKVSVNAAIDSVEKRKLRFDFLPKEEMRYEVELLPGAVLDIFGLSNADTIRRAWTAGAEKDFGTLNLTIKSLRPDTNYVIRLLAKDDKLFKTFIAEGVAEYQTILKYLPPDTYTIEVIEDLDKNGRWTTGNYDAKRQPERVQRATLEEVRANWEVDSKVEWNPVFSPQPLSPQSTSPQSSVIEK